MVFPQSSSYPRSLKNRAPAAFLGYRKKKAVFSRVKNRLGFAGKQRVREQGRPKGFPPAFRASRFASLSEPLFLDKKIDRPPLSFKRRRSCSPAVPLLLPCCPGPVSYTHLDVYKRQAQSPVSPFFIFPFSRRLPFPFLSSGSVPQKNILRVLDQLIFDGIDQGDPAGLHHVA